MRYAPPPSPGRAQHTLLHKRVGRHPADPRTPRRAAQTPVHLALFDIPHLGQPLLTLPYADRRTTLERLDLDGPHWSTPAALTGHDAEARRATREHGLEGLVRKRLDSAHEPGVRPAPGSRSATCAVRTCSSAAGCPARGARQGPPDGSAGCGAGRAARRRPAAVRRQCRHRLERGRACRTRRTAAGRRDRRMPLRPRTAGGRRAPGGTPAGRRGPLQHPHPGRDAAPTAPAAAAAAPGPRTGRPEDRRSPRRIYPSVKEVA